MRRQLKTKSRERAAMLADGFAVEINVGDNRGRLETDEDPFSLPSRRHIEHPRIPAGSAKVAVLERGIALHALLGIEIVPDMRNRDRVPIFGWRRGINILLDKLPIRREINIRPLGFNSAGTAQIESQNDQKKRCRIVQIHGFLFWNIGQVTLIFYQFLQVFPSLITRIAGGDERHHFGDADQKLAIFPTQIKFNKPDYRSPCDVNETESGSGVISMGLCPEVSPIIY